VPTFASETLHDFARAVFIAARVPPEEAEVVATSLVDANLCGHDSHGLIRIPQYLKAIEIGQLRPGQELVIERETPALVAADGGWGLGQVQAHRLLKRLLPKARTIGIGVGTLRHCGHVGRLGEYAEAAACHLMAFLGMVNNHGYGKGVAPPGGTEGRIGTNPICLGAPTISDPVVLDIGTSVCAEGKVRVAFNKGERVPEGWLLDGQGRPTTDPAVLYQEPRGTILPLGGPHAYKGFGLGLLLDMLAGGLSGGPCSHPSFGPRAANAVLFLVFCPEQFFGAGHFVHEVTTLAASVRACPRAEGTGEITLPGDPERRTRQARRAQGVPLDDGTWGQLVDVARGLGVAVPA